MSIPNNVHDIELGIVNEAKGIPKDAFRKLHEEKISQNNTATPLWSVAQTPERIGYGDKKDVFDTPIDAAYKSVASEAAIVAIEHVRRNQYSPDSIKQAVTMIRNTRQEAQDYLEGKGDVDKFIQRLSNFSYTDKDYKLGYIDNQGELGQRGMIYYNTFDEGKDVGSKFGMFISGAAKGSAIYNAYTALADHEGSLRNMALMENTEHALLRNAVSFAAPLVTVAEMAGLALIPYAGAVAAVFEPVALGAFQDMSDSVGLHRKYFKANEGTDIHTGEFWTSRLFDLATSALSAGTGVLASKLAWKLKPTTLVGRAGLEAFRNRVLTQAALDHAFDMAIDFGFHNLLNDKVSFTTSQEETFSLDNLTAGDVAKNLAMRVGMRISGKIANNTMAKLGKTITGTTGSYRDTQSEVFNNTGTKRIAEIFFGNKAVTRKDKRLVWQLNILDNVYGSIKDSDAALANKYYSNTSSGLGALTKDAWKDFTDVYLAKEMTNSIFTAPFVKKVNSNGANLLGYKPDLAKMSSFLVSDLSNAVNVKINVLSGDKPDVYSNVRSLATSLGKYIVGTSTSGTTEDNNAMKTRAIKAASMLLDKTTFDKNLVNKNLKSAFDDSLLKSITKAIGDNPTMKPADLFSDYYNSLKLNTSGNIEIARITNDDFKELFNSGFKSLSVNVDGKDELFSSDNVSNYLKTQTALKGYDQIKALSDLSNDIAPILQKKANLDIDDFFTIKDKIASASFEAGEAYLRNVVAAISSTNGLSDSAKSTIVYNNMVKLHTLLGDVSGVLDNNQFNKLSKQVGEIKGLYPLLANSSKAEVNKFSKIIGDNPSYYIDNLVTVSSINENVRATFNYLTMRDNTKSNPVLSSITDNVKEAGRKLNAYEVMFDSDEYAPTITIDRGSFTTKVTLDSKYIDENVSDTIQLNVKDAVSSYPETVHANQKDMIEKGTVWGINKLFDINYVSGNEDIAYVNSKLKQYGLTQYVEVTHDNNELTGVKFKNQDASFDAKAKNFVEKMVVLERLHKHSLVLDEDIDANTNYYKGFEKGKLLDYSSVKDRVIQQFGFYPMNQAIRYIYFNSDNYNDAVIATKGFIQSHGVKFENDDNDAEVTSFAASLVKDVAINSNIETVIDIYNSRGGLSTRVSSTGIPRYRLVDSIPNKDFAVVMIGSNIDVNDATQTANFVNHLEQHGMIHVRTSTANNDLTFIQPYKDSLTSGDVLKMLKNNIEHKQSLFNRTMLDSSGNIIKSSLSDIDITSIIDRASRERDDTSVYKEALNKIANHVSSVYKTTLEELNGMIPKEDVLSSNVPSDKLSISTIDSALQEIRALQNIVSTVPSTDIIQSEISKELSLSGLSAIAKLTGSDIMEQLKGMRSDEAIKTLATINDKITNLKSIKPFDRLQDVVEYIDKLNELSSNTPLSVADKNRLLALKTIRSTMEMYKDVEEAKQRFSGMNASDLRSTIFEYMMSGNIVFGESYSKRGKRWTASTLGKSFVDKDGLLAKEVGKTFTGTKRIIIYDNPKIEGTETYAGTLGLSKPLMDAYRKFFPQDTQAGKFGIVSSVGDVVKTETLGTQYFKRDKTFADRVNLNSDNDIVITTEQMKLIDPSFLKVLKIDNPTDVGGLHVATYDMTNANDRALYSHFVSGITLHAVGSSRAQDIGLPLQSTSSTKSAADYINQLATDEDITRGVDAKTIYSGNIDETYNAILSSINRQVNIKGGAYLESFMLNGYDDNDVKLNTSAFTNGIANKVAFSSDALHSILNNNLNNASKEIKSIASNGITKDNVNQVLDYLVDKKIFSKIVTNKGKTNEGTAYVSLAIRYPQQGYYQFTPSVIEGIKFDCGHSGVETSFAGWVKIQGGDWDGDKCNIVPCDINKLYNINGTDGNKIVNEISLGWSRGIVASRLSSGDKFTGNTNQKFSYDDTLKMASVTGATISGVISAAQFEYIANKGFSIDNSIIEKAISDVIEKGSGVKQAEGTTKNYVKLNYQVANDASINNGNRLTFLSDDGKETLGGETKFFGGMNVLFDTEFISHKNEGDAKYRAFYAQDLSGSGRYIVYTSRESDKTKIGDNVIAIVRDDSAMIDSDTLRARIEMFTNDTVMNVVQSLADSGSDIYIPTSMRVTTPAWLPDQLYNTSINTPKYGGNSTIFNRFNKDSREISNGISELCLKASIASNIPVGFSRDGAVVTSFKNISNVEGININDYQSTFVDIMYNKKYYNNDNKDMSFATFKKTMNALNGNNKDRKETQSIFNRLINDTTFANIMEESPTLRPMIKRLRSINTHTATEIAIRNPLRENLTSADWDTIKDEYETSIQLYADDKYKAIDEITRLSDVIRNTISATAIDRSTAMKDYINYISETPIFVKKNGDNFSETVIKSSGRFGNPVTYDACKQLCNKLGFSIKEKTVNVDINKAAEVLARLPLSATKKMRADTLEKFMNIEDKKQSYIAYEIVRESDIEKSVSINDFVQTVNNHAKTLQSDSDMRVLSNFVNSIVSSLDNKSQLFTYAALRGVTKTVAHDLEKEFHNNTGKLSLATVNKFVDLLGSKNTLSSRISVDSLDPLLKNKVVTNNIVFVRSCY